ncbi:MAG: exopolysaccharide biosynthesis protein [Clostridia bacterium]|nr:exopolysaccharide biosynthesis protein [Clostridia bacterium]
MLPRLSSSRSDSRCIPVSRNRNYCSYSSNPFRSLRCRNRTTRIRRLLRSLSSPRAFHAVYRRIPGILLSFHRITGRRRTVLPAQIRTFSASRTGLRFYIRALSPVFRSFRPYCRPRSTSCRDLRDPSVIRAASARRTDRRTGRYTRRSRRSS